MSVYPVGPWCLRPLRPEEGVRFSGIGVIESCEMLGIEPELLEKQSVLLLQSCFLFVSLFVFGSVIQVGLKLPFGVAGTADDCHCTETIKVACDGTTGVCHCGLQG